MKRTLLTLAIASLFLAAGINADPGMGMGKRGGSAGSCRMDCNIHGTPGQPGGGPGGPGIRGLLMHADDLELTDAQVEQLKGLEVDFQTERIDAQAELQKSAVKLRSLMHNDNASETEVNAAIDRQARLRADLQKMRYRHHQAVKKLLTEEQQEKLRDMAMRPRFGLQSDDEDDDDDMNVRPRRDRIHRQPGGGW